MGGNDEIVLLKVQLDEANVEERLVANRVALDELKKSQRELDQLYKLGLVNAKEYAKASELNAKAQRELSAEMSQQRKTLADNTQQQKSAEGSINQMRATLSLATAQWNALSKAERENEDVGGALRKQIRALSDELKDQESSVGDNRRNVGNYIKELNVMGVNVGEVADKFQNGQQGVQVFAKAILTGRGALIALTAVPIVLFLTGLVLLLTKTQGAMDKVAQFFKAGELALSALTDGLIKNTKAILEAFTSWDKFKNLLPTLRKNAQETTAAMKEAAAAGMETAAANQRIEDAEIRLSVTRAQNRKEIERLKFISEDASRSATSRAKAAKAAFDLENRSTQEALKLQRERIANLEREFKYTKQTREDARKLAEERVKLAEIEEESLGRQTELNNSLNTIRQEAAQKAADARKRAADDAVAEVNRAIIMAKRKGEDTLRLEEELIRRQARVDKLGAENSAAQRKLIEAKANADILALRVEHAAKLNAIAFEATVNRINAQLALVRSGSEKEYQLQQDLLVQNLDAQKSALVDAAGDLNSLSVAERKKLNTALRLLDAQYNAQKEALDRQFNERRVKANEEVENLILQAEVDNGFISLERRRKIEERRIDLERETALKLIEIEYDLNNLDEQAAKERAAKIEAIYAKSVAQRRELFKKIRQEELNLERAQNDNRLLLAAEGSRAELNLRLRDLTIQMKQEIEAVEDNEALVHEIREKYRILEERAIKQFNQQRFADFVALTGESASVLQNIMQTQSQAVLSELERQQEAAVRSAGANATLREAIEKKYQAKREKLEREAAEKRKKIATAENLISILQASTENLKNFAKNPVYGAFMEALILLKGYANQAAIDAQEFADGGVAQWVSRYVSDGKGAYLRGPGTGRSDSISARLSNGESVMNAVATEKYYNLLSAINQSTGGRAFPGAAPVSLAQETRPSVVPSFSYGGVALTSDAESIASALAAKINTVQPVLIMTDLNAVQNDMKRIDNRATIG